MNLERLFFLREEKDLTQETLASILKLGSRTSISDWETGRETIPLRQLNKYANYFNVSIDYIVGLTKKRDIKIENKELDLKVIAERLKEIRKANEEYGILTGEAYNLTQEKLADELNTTHSTLSAYENAKVLIKTSFLYQIAKHYKYSIDWILGKIN